MARKSPNGQTLKLRSRYRLWRAQNGRCHFCGVQTVFPDKGNGKQTPKPNWATLEHLDDRYSPNRGKYPGDYRRVMACWQCNHDRNVERQKSIPIDELRRRASH